MMRQRTKEQKELVTTLSGFWGAFPRKRGEKVKRKYTGLKAPWKNALDKDGNVVLIWWELRPTDRFENTALGTMLDFCEDRGWPVKFCKASEVIPRKEAQFMRSYTSLGTPVLVVYIPGGPPKITNAERVEMVRQEWKDKGEILED
jgi:hypothetical protein